MAGRSTPGSSFPAASEPPDDSPRSEDSQHLIDRLTNSVAKKSPAFQGAWAKLEDRYKKRLFRFVERQMGAVLKRRYEPDDVVNEAWARAFRHLDHFEYRGPLSFFHWLKQQSRRVILELARKEERRAEVRREGDLSGSTSFREPENESAGPVSRAAQGEMRRVLEASLEEIPALYRDVLRDFYLLEKPRDEIAKSHGRLPNTITHQLKRGLDYWKKSIERRLGPGTFDTWFGRG